MYFSSNTSLFSKISLYSYNIIPLVPIFFNNEIITNILINILLIIAECYQKHQFIIQRSKNFVNKIKQVKFIFLCTVFAKVVNCILYTRNFYLKIDVDKYCHDITSIHCVIYHVLPKESRQLKDKRGKKIVQFSTLPSQKLPTGGGN